jgi:hypothetical protein
MGGNKQPYEQFSTGRVTVTTSPTKILAGIAGCDNISIINTSAATVFLGGPNVTAANGFPMTGTGTVGSLVDLCTTNDIYGLVSSGSADVAYMATS